MIEDKIYTSKEAADICGVSLNRIQQFCNTFEIEKKKVGRYFMYQITKQNIETIITRKHRK